MYIYCATLLNNRQSDTTPQAHKHTQKVVMTNKYSCEKNPVPPLLHLSRITNSLPTGLSFSKLQPDRWEEREREHPDRQRVRGYKQTDRKEEKTAWTTDKWTHSGDNGQYWTSHSSCSAGGIARTCTCTFRYLYTFTCLHFYLWVTNT